MGKISRLGVTRADLPTPLLERRWTVFGGERATLRRAQAPGACVVVVDDDGAEATYTTLWPLFRDRNVPLTAAIVTSAIGTVSTSDGTTYQHMSVDQLRALGAAGCEIAGHTHTHRALTQITLAEAEAELRTARAVLQGLGFRTPNHIHPFGDYNRAVSDLTRTMYRSACKVGGGLTVPQPVPTFEIPRPRVAVGSFTAAGQNTEAYYKARIDEAVARRRPVVFMTHCWHPSHDAAQQAALAATLDYAISLGVPILTLDQMLDRYGNLDESGYPGAADALVRDGSGRLWLGTHQLATSRVIPATGIDNTTPITSFAPGEVSTTHLPFGTAANGMPGAKPGTLITDRTRDEAGYGGQEYREYNGTRVWTRRWVTTSGGSWTAWVEQAAAASSLLVVGAKNAVTGTTAVADYPAGVISLIRIDSSNKAGFPGIGTVLTDRTSTVQASTEPAWQTQLFLPYNGYGLWQRTADSSGVWGPWVSIAGITARTSVTYNWSTAIAAGGVAEAEFAVPGAVFSDAWVFNTNSALPVGLIVMQPFTSGADKVKVRIFNGSGAALAPGNLTWGFRRVTS